MGTEVTALVPPGVAVEAVRRRFGAVEAACSRFLPDSDLSRVNRSPAGRIVMPGLLAEVVAAGAVQRDLTGGLVDAGMGALVRSWGYDATFEEVVGLDAEPDPGDTPAWAVRNGVLHRRPGMLLDLGGVAKGWTADRAVEAGEAVVVSAGGDVRSSDPATVVDVLGPEGSPAASLHLGAAALATSSTSRRRWIVEGRPAHHLIDSRTGRPASTPVVSASTICRTAVEAEAAAKAVLLLGAEGLAWASRMPWVRDAVVVWHDGTVYATRGVEVA